MLDAYIIDRIRRDREREQERSRPALRIPPPPPPDPPKDRKEGDDEGSRGVVIVDYRLYFGVMSTVMWLNHISGCSSHSGFSSGS